MLNYFERRDNMLQNVCI